MLANSYVKNWSLNLVYHKMLSIKEKYNNKKSRFNM